MPTGNEEEEQGKTEALGDGANQQTRVKVMNNKKLFTVFLFSLLIPDSKDPSPRGLAVRKIQRRDSLLVDAMVELARTGSFRSAEVPPKLF